MTSALLLISSWMILILQSSENVFESKLLLSEEYPGFDGVDPNIIECDLNTKSGAFTFDSGRGIAYFVLSNTMFYIEYYAPTLYWTGHSPADQFVDGKNLECIKCYEFNPNDKTKCVNDCIVDHIFIVTGQSENVNEWISLELQINSDLKLPNLKNMDEITNEEIKKIEICENNGLSNNCYHYTHVKYYRNYENINGDKFQFIQNNNNNRACFSWITSNPSEGAFITAVKASNVYNYGIVCTNIKLCNECYDMNGIPIFNTNNNNQNENDENIFIPLSPDRFIIPSHSCITNDLSLIFVMDLSDSINSNSMDISKKWIAETINYSKQFTEKYNLNLRTSLITFSSKIELIWNLDSNQDEIYIKLNEITRPHDPLIELGQTYTADALKNVINNILPFQNMNTNDQLLVIILTDGMPSNEYQNPCSNINLEISNEFHTKNVRTIIVAIEQGLQFSMEPFQCLYYPYSTEQSFIIAENFQSLLAHSIDAIIIDAAFPKNCDVNNDIKVPSILYHSNSESKEEENHDLEDLSHDLHDDNDIFVEYNLDKCIKPERYIPIRKYISLDEGQEYKECNSSSTEWRIELLNWEYNKENDKTIFIYDVCTSYLKPFNHCIISEFETNELSKHLKSIAIQMPCECEICIAYGTHKMEPNGGSFAQLEKAWIWSDLDIKPGECLRLSLEIMGYANSVRGNYYLEGNDKYEIGLIGVPNPCTDGLDDMIYPIPHIASKDLLPNPNAAKCKNEDSIEPYYPSYCKGFCNPKQMEYNIKFIEYKYSHGSDKTIFTYSLHTLKPSNLPKDFCSYYPYEESIPLSEIHISIPCQCQFMLQNGNVLFYTTDGMIINNNNNNNNNNNTKNGISEFHWHFTDLNVKIGETKNISIILNGMIPFGMGDYTLIGEMNRCGYGRHIIRVPDICNNRCLWGQWTKWDTKSESCSKKCGGGITKRKRKCVSVCDGKTPVYNCYGDEEEIIPCNTNECGEPNYHNQNHKIKYWSAYSQ